MRFSSMAVAAALAGVLAACSGVAQLPVTAGMGPTPALPPPQRSLIPTVHIAEAIGWPANAGPVAADGLAVNRFADGLAHPRWICVLANGDVLVAETDAPPKPDDAKGIKGFVMKLVMKRAGSSQGSANRITLLRDADGDGIVDTRTVFLSNVNSPFGIAQVGGYVYVAATDALLRFPYRDGDTTITDSGTKIVDLPAGPINHHWTKNVDGARLPAPYANGMFVGQHGSWNRKPRSGYAVIFVPFTDGRPSGMPRTVLSGFVTPDGKAQGRPVGVAIDKRGALLVADDVGNTVWRVTARAAQ